MKIKYIFNLYKQYCASIGKEYNEFNIINDFEFILWIESLSKQTKLYGEYLKYLYGDLKSSNTIEIGKGKYDSLGDKLVTIVSPFAETLGYRNCELIVQEDKAYVIMGTRVFTVDGCNLYLTHNPFVKNSIVDMTVLHSKGKNICLGMYGSVNDKDKNLKIQLLEKTLEKMSDGIEFCYDTLDDTYFCCVKSKEKVKKKTLIR